MEPEDPLKDYFENTLNQIIEFLEKSSQKDKTIKVFRTKPHKSANAHHVEEKVIDTVQFPKGTKINFVEMTLPQDNIDNLADYDKSRNSREELERAYSRFGTQTHFFIDNNVPLEIANKYSDRWRFSEIINMYEAGCGPEIANRMPPYFLGTEIAIMHHLGLTADEIEIEKKMGTHKATSQAIKIIPELNTGALNNTTLLGLGKSAIVLKREGRAIKFSEKANNEFQNFEIVQKYHQNRQKNIVKHYGTVIQNIAIELEPINGITLEDTVKNRKLCEQEVISYGYQILNGLIELRQAGLCHRDLHSRNIIINPEEKIAKIIDLGSASTDFNISFEGNKTYGENNDLLSLGQLMYKLATGRHPFNQKTNYTWEPKNKIDIREKRRRMYQNTDLAYLFKHDAKIEVYSATKSAKLVTIISTLLEAPINHQPDLKELSEIEKQLFI